MVEDVNRYRLAGGRYEPTTYNLVFFRGDYRRVATYYQDWAKNIIFPQFLTNTEENLAGEAIFDALNPLTRAESKIIFAQCRNGWTVMLTNSPKPVDYTTIMWNMKKKYLLDSVFIRYVPNIYPPKNYKELEKYRESYGSIRLTYYNGSGQKICGNNRGRSLHLGREGVRKWFFQSSGNPFEFEDTNVYSKHKVTDRFSPEILLHYARQLGIDPYNLSFYTGPALVCNVDAPWMHEDPESLRPLSFAQARKEYKLDHLYDSYGDDEDSSKTYLDDVQKNESKKSDEFEPLDEYQADSLRLSELQALLPLPVEQVSVGNLNFSFTGNKDNSSFKLYVDCDWRIASALEKNRLEEFPKNQQEPIKALQGGMIIAVEADTPDAYDPLITVRDIHGEDWVIHILSEDENAPWGVIQNREQIIEGPSWQAHEAWKEARCQETER